MQMSFFLGEVVRWTPGENYALVKPVIGINDGHVHTLTPRELEIEFLETGKAAWHQPGKRCQVGRKVIFKKEDGEPTTKTTSSRKLYSILPVVPEIVITENLSTIKTHHPIEKKLQRMATQLTSSGAHEFAHEFRVFLKFDTRVFDYFGPFGQDGSIFSPPQNLSKIKRYEANGKGLPTIYLDELDLEIVKPSLFLEKIQEISIKTTIVTVAEPEKPSQSEKHSEIKKIVENPNPNQNPSQVSQSLDHPHSSSESKMLSVALKKLQDNLPVNSLQHDLNFLLETLEKTKVLSDSEKDLLSDALLEGRSLGQEIQRLLPIFHEHIDFAGYFDKELQTHKKRAEQQIKNELEQRMDSAMAEVLHEQEQVRGERENLARERERLSALMEEHRRASEQLDIQKQAVLIPQGSSVIAGGAPISADEKINSDHPAPSVSLMRTEGVQAEPSDVIEALREHPPMARLQAAWIAGRVPLACGPKSMRLMKRFADLICGGVMRWTSISPLLTEVRDLIGTFHDGWFRPHPSGIALLLLKVSRGESPALVVLEGANRAPLELVLEPLLHSRESGLPLFSPEAFRPEDPWQMLGQTSWPKSALIGCTLTTGQARQPISPVLWDRLMAVDESGWPKKEIAQNKAYVPLDKFFDLATPRKDRDTEDALQQFHADVVDSKWAIPGALKLAGLAEDLGVPNAANDTFVLSLGCAALCAGAEVESDSLAKNDTQRLERLRHYLI